MSFGFFHTILWKKLKELFGEPNITFFFFKQKEIVFIYTVLQLGFVS